MKLKKIASLMLAGIMAVSMLAGCKTADNGGNGGEGETDVTPTSATAVMLRDYLDGDAKREVVAVADNDLDTALKNAVDTYFVNSGYNGLTTTPTERTTSKSKIAESVYDAMKADGTNISQVLTDSVDKDKIVVKLYAVSGDVSDAYALEQIADILATNLGNLKDKSSNENYDYDYTIAASIVTKSGVVDGNDKSVKYIAVAVAQNVSEVA